MKLKDNTLLITGGSTGIGLKMAEGFLDRGNRVAICGRRESLLEDVRRRLPGIKAYRCDVTVADERARLLSALEADGYLPNVLINNAAVLHRHDLTAGNNAGGVNALPQLALAEVDAAVATNLLAPIALNEVFLPVLLRQRDPAIINVTSPAGLIPLWNVPIYSATKAALNAYTKSLRYQLRGRVEVIELYPPTVDTEMTTQIDLPKISTDAFAQELFQRLARSGNSIWVGEGRYIKWIHSLSPALAYWIVSSVAEKKG